MSSHKCTENCNIHSIYVPCFNYAKCLACGRAWEDGEEITNEQTNNMSESKLSLSADERKQLTLIATAAMQGILSGADKDNPNGIHVNEGCIHPGTVAKDAVNIALALINEIDDRICRHKNRVSHGLAVQRCKDCGTLITNF